MQTRVFLAMTKPLEDPVLYDRLYAAATETRKRKIDRYRFLEDRLQSLTAEGLLLHAWREAGRTGALSYAYGENGKPYFQDAPELRFSLSHSGEAVMLAVSDAEIGCDVERIRHADERLMKRVAAPEEYETLTTCAGSARDERFTRLWVAKESVLKAGGEGLLVDPASIRIETEPELRAFRDGEPVPFALRDGTAAPGYRYAVCRAGELPAFEIEEVDLSRLAARDAERESFEREILTHLAAHRLRYPLMEADDVVKFVFQAMLGVGHLLSSREAVEAYAAREMRGLAPDPDEPLFEPLSPAWQRLNLRRAMAEGMTPADVAERMFAPHAGPAFTRRDVYGFCIGRAQVGAESLERLLDETLLPSHSQAYRDAYRPAYRVVPTDRNR
jgi:4'-phosphopantetheinyl transferase